MSARTKRLRRFPLLVAVICGLVIVSATVSSAQLGIFPTPTPKPKPSVSPPPASATPPPATASPTPSAAVPSGILPTPKATPTDEPTAEPKSEETEEEELADLPDALEEDLVVPSFPRTRPRNTVALVKTLRELTELGVPLEQALIEGMGRFPVAGLAHYFDDWMNPRFTPKPHLHEGLDIFADFGTPIRAPDEGVVTALPGHGAGGIAVWMRARDGTSYYFAHMLERAADLRVGQRVDIGTVLGFIGDTGNAQGGTPHLHLEIHPGGGEAVPPKPTVDAWLDEAEAIAPKWVEARRTELRSNGRLSDGGAGPAANAEELEASILLTLLDPVGGSVGLLPSLEVEPRRSGAVSDRLLDDLIQQRVGGDVLLPSSATHHFD